MNSVKKQPAIFRKKLEILHNNKVLRKQQSLGWRLKNLYPKEDIKEKYFVLNCRTDFTFKRHMLVIEIDKKGHDAEIQIMKNKDKKN